MDNLAARGIDVGAFLEELGLPNDLLENPDARLRRSQQEALWRHAIEVTGDPLLPARVAQAFPPETIGVFTYLAKASGTGPDAVHRIRNIVGLMQDGSELELRFEPGLAVLRVENRDGYIPILPASEYSAALHVFIGRALSEGKREPAEVRIAHPAPPHAAEFEALLGVPVRWGSGENAVAFPREQFGEPLPGADPGLSELLERYAVEMLSRIPSDDSFVDRVCDVLTPRLPDGSPGIEDVAAELRMSARSVRRRLREEGTTYRETLDSLRSALAKRQLEEGEKNVEEIAHGLGFSDASAFHKAFRRWTGSSPADYSRSGAQ